MNIEKKRLQKKGVKFTRRRTKIIFKKEQPLKKKNPTTKSKRKALLEKAAAASKENIKERKEQKEFEFRDETFNVEAMNIDNKEEFEEHIPLKRKGKEMPARPKLPLRRRRRLQECE